MAEKTVLTKTLQDASGNLIAPRTYADAVKYSSSQTVEDVLDALSTNYAAAGHNHDSSYAKLTQLGTASTTGTNAVTGIATLGTDGKVPTTQLPSYVDDVVDCYYDSTANKIYKEAAKTNEITGETGKIYIDLSTNKTYRYSGSTFVEVSQGSVVTASTTNGKVSVDGSDVTVVTDMTGASSSANGTNGMVPAPSKGDEGKFLKGDGTWATAYTHPAPTAQSSTSFKKFNIDANGHVTDVAAVTASDVTGLSGIGMTGATSSANGATGLVPAPATTDVAKYLKGDGTWDTPYTHPTPTAQSSTAFKKLNIDANGHVTDLADVAASDVLGLSGIDMGAASSTAAGTHGMVPAPAKGDQTKFLQGDGTWAVPTGTYEHPAPTAQSSTGFKKLNTDTNGHVTDLADVAASDVLGLSGIDMGGATASADGTHGMVPAPTKSDVGKFLKGDGTWATAYTHPTPTAQSSTAFKKFNKDTNGHITDVADVAASDVLGLSGIDMVGATASNAGTHGMVPAPAKGDEAKFLMGNGTWAVSPVAFVDDALPDQV